MKLWEQLIGTFGIKLKDLNPDKGPLESVDIPYEKGAVPVEVTTTGGVIGFSSNLNAIPTDEVQLIKTYRTLAVTAEIDRVLTEIRNEIFIFDDLDQKAVDISFNNTEQLDISEQLMDKIREEYDFIYNDLLDFQRKGIEYFDRWYIDGRLFLQKVVDKTNIKKGLRRFVLIDPLKIRRMIEYPKPDSHGIYDLTKMRMYYMFSDTHDVYGASVSKALEIHKDAISYIDSGLYDQNSGQVLSYIWKMIVPYNNMKMMEEALLIYRVVRSPERRVFYINVGGLSKTKAEQYIQELMAKFRNKLVYDASSGTLADRKNVLSMVEDFWLPRRDDGKGTEISSLPGASNLGNIDDVDLFKNKFYESTNVPRSRFREDNASFQFGRATEINRDEYRFKKFLDMLRNRFVVLFEDLLKTQLILKNVILESDWERIKRSINWVYAEDNNFIQWKESQVLQNQIESLNDMERFIGIYFTRSYALKKAMNLSDEVIDDMLTAAKVEKYAEEEEERRRASFAIENAVKPSMAIVETQELFEKPVLDDSLEDFKNEKQE